jgi:uncharacterized protein YjeT (DUF2065 family)
MAELGTALALILIIEGALYALFPEAMKRMMRMVLEQSPDSMRTAGLAAAIAGVGLLWLIRG